MLRIEGRIPRLRSNTPTRPTPTTNLPALKISRFYANRNFFCHFEVHELEYRRVAQNRIEYRMVEISKKHQGWQNEGRRQEIRRCLTGYDRTRPSTSIQ